ncbi:ubiquitin elongating factor core-domain-containing protein [Podospora fimiseda]|uniref:Ubiquitin elongating factor core-domain-containing protein n=1 Tax=Podospora fimiseda TaxID=252190 RepID=A0AAN6YNG5_9PEZI|nr:ubiquitin elongating factor core-domain-containing protein [Podospora fimiseda]
MDPNDNPQQPDAPDQETMEQIRRRRLAKLGGPPSGSSTPTPVSPTTSGAPVVGQSSSSPVENRPQINISGSLIADELRSKRRASDVDGPSSIAPPRKQTPMREEAFEDWADRTLSSLFRISIDATKTSDVHGHKLTFLPNLSQELSEEVAPLKLSVERLEEAIMEAGTEVPHNRPLFDYLLGCWKRIVRMLRTLHGPAPAKQALLKEARRLCFSNCIFALTMPELFGREQVPPPADPLVPYLLRGIDSESGIDLEFLGEASARVGEDESIGELFANAMAEISRQLAGMTMNDDYQPHVNAMLSYTRFSVLLNEVARHDSFYIKQTAPAIEKNTILGPFFRISPLQPDVSAVYFPGPRTMDKGRIQASQSALQQTLAPHQHNLKTIIDAFVRASPETRNKVLDWFAHIMNVNHKRRAIQVDPREVSSDGFMVNVTVVLDILCEPFMDTTFSKVGRINIDYFRRNPPRLDIREETKLNADQAYSDAFYANKVEGEDNFITEIFFLTLAAHHYGSEATNSKLKNLDKDIKYYLKNVALMEAERAKLLNRPVQLAQLDAALRRHTTVLEKAMAMKYSIEGVLLEPNMQDRSLKFMRYVTVWLLRVASKTEYTPDKQLQLPLPESQPDAFRCLPEYALQDIVDNFKFVFRYIPSIILSAVGDEMIALCITFLESSEYVKNPYLKSSLVTLLAHGTWPAYHRKQGILGDLLISTTFANKYLLHALMKFYIECESTGLNSQFYDKFNIRYEIFQVVKCVWINDVYRKQLIQSSKSNRSFFVRFVNLLMNDATYVLDEGLGKFPKIHELQNNLRDPSHSEQDRVKLEEDLRQTEATATSYMQLANETVSMMKLFTATLSEAFTMPEIVQRLAGMLDYNLELLTGPKSKNLKVENPDQYSFNPKTLLAEITDIYLNLGQSPAFIEAVAGDGRSYKASIMTMTAHILRTKHLKDEPAIRKWEELSKKFESAKVILDRAELDFDDAPPEFEDPIMGILMSDPVVLPSKHTVDRSTIMQHLLSDPKDPYTRQPMTIDDVIPATELKEKIEAWKAERRARASGQVAEVAAGADGDVMDTTE